jgi:hypothetical protein
MSIIVWLVRPKGLSITVSSLQKEKEVRVKNYFLFLCLFDLFFFENSSLCFLSNARKFVLSFSVNPAHGFIFGEYVLIGCSWTLGKAYALRLSSVSGFLSSGILSPRYSIVVVKPKTVASF